jgi:hypothetical protein
MKGNLALATKMFDAGAIRQHFTVSNHPAIMSKDATQLPFFLS